uniref:Uncharacterized protein n=1 Tax=Noctiluca scintillans TaxID=2966 RepID=A0A7S1F612_NOCSC|mmetsp:Transcript_36924/g.98374  ORF Transcript_36924/g.98374 Transcript_36924/m.98374 type:complete len:164 (+) Transcript_36924:104-595(+)
MVAGVDIFTWYYVFLMFLVFILLAFFTCCFQTEAYKLFPRWGPIVKFDSHNDEGMRINQFLLAQHVQNYRPPEPVPEHTVKYGALGESTWGHCEAPMERVPFVHPTMGEVIMIQGFPATQEKRAHSRTWARDEPYFMKEKGIKQKILTPDDMTGSFVYQQMVP